MLVLVAVGSMPSQEVLVLVLQAPGCKSGLAVCATCAQEVQPASQLCLVCPGGSTVMAACLWGQRCSCGPAYPFTNSSTEKPTVGATSAL